MFDLELLTPSMNYIPVRKENYADSGEQETTYDDVEDLDDQQFIVHGPNIHAAKNKHSEERTADKEVRIYQKSQENRQKRANTDTRNGRAQKKPGIQSRSQEKSTMVKPQSKKVKP
ncbi:hypothetical protein Tco_1356528 [Tanacetum coccineum]